MQRIEIISDCLIPGGRTLFTGSVIDIDDDVAGQLVAAQRARLVDEDTKLKDTSKAALAEADARAEASTKPEAAQAALVAQLVQEQLAKLLPGAAVAQAADDKQA